MGLECIPAMDDYDVFVNYCGPDVKAGFIAHLEDALSEYGMNPFLDKKSENPPFGAIDAALAMAKVHVAVVSRGYAESKYCLNELVFMLKSKKSVTAVFYDVEPWELRRVEGGQFAAALEKHKLRETEETVQEWVDALCKLADDSGFCFRSADYQEDEAELQRKMMKVAVQVMVGKAMYKVKQDLRKEFASMREEILKESREYTDLACAKTSKHMNEQIAVLQKQITEINVKIGIANASAIEENHDMSN